MTLTLKLTKELEQRLQQAARQQGLPADEYVVQVLDEHLRSTALREELLALLQTWIDEDNADEQRETGEYLIRALDEDRLSERTVFPTQLKGVSW